MRFIRGPVIGALATCLALSSTLTGSATVGAAQAAPAGTTKTPFGLTAAGYGTRVQGGSVPAESGRTAFSVIGCTKLAGLEKRNQLAGVNLEGEVRVKGISTQQKTTRETSARNGNAVSARSLTKVTSVGVGPAITGLKISGLRLRTRAFHDDRGFRTEREASLADITLAGVDVLDAGLPGDVIDVPGVATVTFLGGKRSTSKNGAVVQAKGLRIELDGTNTVITVGSAFSQISNRVPAGILGGYGRAGNVRVVQGTIKSGKLAVQPLPCQGTNGEWRRNATGRVHLPGTLVIGGAVGSARGDQISRTNAYGMTRGKITRAAIGGNGLVITGIKAQANVRKDGNRLIKSAKGSTLATITVNGNPRPVPGAGETVTLGGVKVTGRKVVRSEFGIKVIALQVRLTDGSFGSTINLGEAFVRIKPF